MRIGLICSIYMLQWHSTTTHQRKHICLVLWRFWCNINSYYNFNLEYSSFLLESASHQARQLWCIPKKSEHNGKDKPMNLANPHQRILVIIKELIYSSGNIWSIDILRIFDSGSIFYYSHYPVEMFIDYKNNEGRMSNLITCFMKIFVW